MDKEKEIKAYLDGELLPEVRMKYEIAEEMGLLDRVLSDGWKSLSAKETGRIGVNRSLRNSIFRIGNNGRHIAVE